MLRHMLQLQCNAQAIIHHTTHRFAVPEALSTIQKAEEVLSLHCGLWDDEIQELQKMKSCLLDLPPTLVRS
ncbi:hypothetical protein H8959_021717 [Pygathrix nigripes]